MRKNDVIVTTSWDDGHELDARLAHELNQHGFAGTFYIAPESWEIPPQKRISAVTLRELGQRFEIGSHTLTHPHLTRLSPGDAAREINQGKEVLQELIGRAVTSFCYPYGAYRAHHVGLVRTAGFLAARTTRRFCTEAPTDPLQMGTSTHASRYRADVWPVVRKSRTPTRCWAVWSNWDVLARQLFDQAKASGGVYHLWGHSWEIGEHNDWSRLRFLLRYIADHGNVTFMTNGELAEAMRGAPAGGGHI
jgi:peptidoglycan-N-acetylglucosamine deacetylase